MDFSIISDETTPLERVLRLRVESSTVASHWKSEVDRLRLLVDIPGFRKGKASDKVVENHVGRGEIWRKVRGEVSSSVVNEVVRSADKKPLTPPEYDFDQDTENASEEDEYTWREGESFEFTVKYMLPPPSPEDIERDLMRGGGIEDQINQPHGVQGPVVPDPTPPDPRDSLTSDIDKIDD